MTEFPNVGGTIGMFRDAILSVSKSDQKDMALGCALAIGGVLTANRFSLNGRPVYTPMYIMNIGGTSSGKDSGIRLIDCLFGPGGLGLNKHYKLLGLTNYSSDVAMISTLPEQRTRLDYFQEFGEVFKGLAMKGDRKSSVGDCLKKLFSAREYFNGHFTKTDGNKGRCAYPSVSVFGTIQPSTLLAHATPEILFDGLLGRFMYFKELEGAGYLGNQRAGGIKPQALTDITEACLQCYPENPILDKDMVGSLITDQSLSDFYRHPIALSTALDTYIGEVDREHHYEMNRLRGEGQEAEAAAYGKVIENAEKIMKILCVGYGERTITRSHFDEAMKIVMVSYNNSKELIVGAAQAKEIRNAEKLLAFVEKQPMGQVRQTKAMKYLHFEVKDMKQAVDYLEETGRITRIAPDPKPANGKKTVYLCTVKL